ncbi:hypothetical protein FRC12_004132 [Ceratobasidium sp. 428]|nr:hypothetical protein FRC12_004132 [Ceratobasidium sp. 428]
MSMSALTASQMRLELYNLLSSTTIGDLKHCMETEYGIPAELQRLDLCGKVLQDTMTLGQCGATDATTFDLSLSTRKTIIYFRPSASGLIFPGKDIKIQIQLNRSWELAMLYPRATGASKDYIQSISWDITVTDAGRIHAGGRTFTGLFWDGISSEPPVTNTPLSSTPLDRSCSKADADLLSTTTLVPGNSVAVPLDQVHHYLSSLLSKLLPEPYPIPHFLGWFTSRVNSGPHTHVALRFPRQAEYQAVAPLSVSEGSGIWVFRVVILYKKLESSTALFWEAFGPSYILGADWPSFIGTEPIIKDPNSHKLTALEITCMEVF